MSVGLFQWINNLFSNGLTMEGEPCIQREMLQTEIRSTIRKTNLFLGALDKNWKMKDRIESLIRNDISKCMLLETNRLINNSPVDDLKKYISGIRVGALHNAGIHFVGQIRNASYGRLTSIRGIGPGSANAIIQARNILAAEAGKRARLHLSVDNRSTEYDELIRDIHKFLNARVVYEIDEELFKTRRTEIRDAVKMAKKVALSNWRWKFLTLKEQQDSLDAYRKIDALTRDELFQKINDLVQQNDLSQPQIINLSWQSFSKNSIAYYGVIDDILNGNEIGYYPPKKRELVTPVKESLEPKQNKEKFWDNKFVEPSSAQTGHLAFGPKSIDNTREGHDPKNKVKQSALPDHIIKAISVVPTESVCLRRCKLYSYQKLGVQYIIGQERVLLGDEMGLGKTIQAIASMAILADQGATVFIVICPLSVLVNWDREIEKFSTIKHFVLYGKALEKNLKAWQEHGGIAITTFESAQRFSLEPGFSLDMSIVDEAHYIKNQKSLRTKATQNFIEKSKRVLFLTGTPIENRVSEMCFLIQMLRPEIAETIRYWGSDLDSERFREIVAPVYFRRTREEVAKEMPELIENEAWCGLEGEEKNKYEMAIKDGDFMKARQISWNVSSASVSSKAQYMLDICENAKNEGRKVILFSFFTHTLEMAMAALGDRAIGPINGSLPVEKRQKLIDVFSESEPGTVLISQIQAGGTGLNIQAASVIILCEPQLKPSIEQQAIARAYRMGQSRNVLVYRLLCDRTIDMEIYKLLQEKQRIFEEYAGKSVAGEKSLEITEEACKNIMKAEFERLIKEKNVS